MSKSSKCRCYIAKSCHRGTGSVFAHHLQCSPRRLQCAQVGRQDLDKEVLSGLSERGFIKLLCGIADGHSPSPSHTLHLFLKVCISSRCPCVTSNATAAAPLLLFLLLRLLLLRQSRHPGEDPGSQGCVQRTFSGRCLQREGLELHSGGERQPGGQNQCVWAHVVMPERKLMHVRK